MNLPETIIASVMRYVPEDETRYRIYIPIVRKLLRDETDLETALGIDEIFDQVVEEEDV